MLHLQSCATDPLVVHVEQTLRSVDAEIVQLSQRRAFLHTVPVVTRHFQGLSSAPAKKAGSNILPFLSRTPPAARLWQ